MFAMAWIGTRGIRELTTRYRPPPAEDRLFERAPELAWGAIAIVLAAGIGAAIAHTPYLGLAAIALMVLVSVAIVDLAFLERSLCLLLVFGATVLGYGWANLGIPGAIPIPATEMIFIPLAAIALADPKGRLGFKPLLPLVLYGIVVAIRLVVDYPTWGIFAIRDTTPALEAFITIVGFRAVKRDGLEYWVDKMRWVAGAVLLWGMIYPLFPNQLGKQSAVGPTVGLQRSTSLLDPRGVKFSAIAFGLYFVVFGRRWTRLAAMIAMIALLGVFQARTLYIALPLALLALGWLTHTTRRIVPEFVATLAVGVVVITFIGNLGIEGSEGPVNLAFLESHASTIVGDQGPHSATITAREDFWHGTLNLMASTPGAYLTGLGLGPNLTFGQWTGNAGQEVRTPHNAYLEVFARTGILGFSLWIWMLLACLIPIGRAAREDRGLRGKFCTWSLVASLVILCVAGFQPVLTFPYGTVPLYFVLGCGVAAAAMGNVSSARSTELPNLA
jgi:hypothetical protein